jgi:hypothetical protein
VAAGGATRVIDEVEYLPRVAWMTARVVRRDVERIFRYRQDVLQLLIRDDLTQKSHEIVETISRSGTPVGTRT